MTIHRKKEDRPSIIIDGVAIDAISIYDTNVPKGENPKIMARVCTTEKKEKIEIFDLDSFSLFAVKGMVNVEAKTQGELYVNYRLPKYQAQNTQHHKAYKIIEMALEARHKSPYKIDIKDKRGRSICIITQNGDNKIDLAISKIFFDIHMESDSVSKEEKALTKNHRPKL